MRKKTKWIIGIDEAGRGPLAGPVAVGVCALPRGFDASLVAGAKDSKQMTPKKRDELFKVMHKLRKEGELSFCVSLVGVATINRVGITGAVRLGIARALKRLGISPRLAEVKLDGLLRAPEEFSDQRTIVRGDQTEIEISLASIAAKVTRDRYMVRLSKKYPTYGFDVHKGYGTAVHCARIRENGPADVHRTLFVRNLRS